MMAVDHHGPAFFIPSSPDHRLSLQNSTTKLHLFASSESGSELSSPSGSDHLGLSSTTTESSEEEEEDCFIGELTRQMAQYMLQDEDKHEKQQLQQQQSNKQTGSGMRPVFLTGSGSRNASGGTGVFLPRGTGGIPCNPRKKKGCATVLIPARVVQALKLHFEKTGVPSRFNTTDFKDACDSMDSLQKGRSGAVAPDTSQHEEVSLPQEWTY